MIFNKLQLAVRLLMVIILSSLVACATDSGDKRKSPRAQKGEANTVPVAAAGASILPPGPVLPNPYLQTKADASRQATQNFNDALRAMRNKQWAQAEILLKKVTEENGKLSGAWLNLGYVYRAQDQRENAEQAFAKAIAANHTNLDAYNALAILNRESGDFAAAEENYRKALSVWPWHADSHKNLAILYDLYMGKSQDALSHYEAYQQLVGDGDKNINSWIADLQRRLGITPKPKNSEPTPASSTSTEEVPSAEESLNE